MLKFALWEGMCAVFTERKTVKIGAYGGAFGCASEKGIRRAEKTIGIRLENRAEFAAGKNTWLIVKNTRHLF